MNTRYLGVTLVVGVLFAFSPGADGGETYWQLDPPGVGDWSDGSNWSAGEPGSGVVAWANNGGTVTITQNGEVAEAVALAYALTDSATVSMTEGTLDVNGVTLVGYHGSADFVHSGGTCTVGNYLMLAYGDGAEGLYRLSGNAQLNVVSHIEVSVLGMGRFEWYGGTVSTPEIIVGAEGTLAIGFDLDVPQFLTGASGIGSFTWKDKGTFEVSNSATGTYSAGVRTMPALRVGSSSGGSGTLNMTGGELSTNYQYIGNGGKMTQVAGKNTVTQEFHLAQESGPSGVYELSGSGELSAFQEYIGYRGNGHFSQTGGLNRVGTQGLGGFHIAYQESSEGTYELSGNGQLDCSSIEIAYSGTGRFVQDGGTVQTDDFVMAMWIPGHGTYELIDGGLTIANLAIIGHRGTGHFIQTGGVFDGAWTVVGWGCTVGGDGTYELRDGEFSSGELEMGILNGSGAFYQTGGTATVGNVNIRRGLYRHSGGTMTADRIDVGTTDGPIGRLELLTGSGGDIFVNNLLYLTSGGALTAEPGAVIHMAGAELDIGSADPLAYAGLRNLTLIFEGGDAVVDPFEVAGQDVLGTAAGYQDNFALGALFIGGADVAQVQLVDVFDNQTSWEGTEALYVENLILEADSILDLNGLNLYYLNADIDPTATVTGGALTQVPVIPGDANLDGVINVGDLGIFGANYGETRRTWRTADFNCDGLVNVGDLAIFAASYGLGGGNVPVPEPATLMLLGAGGMALLRRRR